MEGSELRKIFSHNLKLMRMRAGLSQLSLANSLNLAPNFISDIECGKKWVSPETLAKLSIALHIEPFQLFLENQEFNAETQKILIAFSDDMTRAIDESINKVRRQYFPSAD